MAGRRTVGTVTIRVGRVLSHHGQRTASDRNGDQGLVGVLAGTAGMEPTISRVGLRVLQDRPRGPDLRVVAGRKLKLRRDDACAQCGAPIVAGTPGWWDRETRTVTCTGCADSGGSSSPPPPASLELGEPGGSLGREHERRRRNREDRIREAYPASAGCSAPWAARLSMKLSPRREPLPSGGWPTRSRSAPVPAASSRCTTAGCPPAAVTSTTFRLRPAGFGSSTQRTRAGKVEIDSPWFGTPRLLIRGRGCTRLIDGLERQISAVRAALDHGGYEPISVRGALCFTKADLPWLRTQSFGGHLLLYRKALAKRLNGDGPLSRSPSRRSHTTSQHPFPRRPNWGKMAPGRHRPSYPYAWRGAVANAPKPRNEQPDYGYPPRLLRRAGGSIAACVVSERGLSRSRR